MDQDTDDNEMDTSPDLYRESDYVMDTSLELYRDPDSMDNPWATNQEPDQATKQEPADIMHNPRATNQAPDDIMNNSWATNQEPDQATNQEPDDIMDNPRATNQEPDNIVDNPRATNKEPDQATNQEPGDIMNNPWATNQEPDNIMDNPRATNQEPDNIMDNPRATNQEPGDIMDNARATNKEPGDIVDNPRETNKEPDQATNQEPGDIVDNTRATNQEPDQATNQEPGDIVDNPRATNQEPGDIMDNARATNKEPGDIVDNTRATNQEPGDIMNNPRATNQEPGDIVDNPWATNQEPGDIMDNPQATNQEPGDIMDNPRATNQKPDALGNPQMTHDVKYIETPPKNNYDPVVTDSATEVELQPTLVSFTSLDQDLGLKTSNKVHGEYKDNVKPVEEGSNLELDFNPNTITVHDLSQRNANHSNPNLTVALFGSSEAVQFGCDNILLGEKQFCLKNKEFPTIIPKQMKISEHHVSVINMIGLHETALEKLDHDIGQLLNENPAFIFVVRLGQLTDEDKMGIDWLQRIFGDRILLIILFTYEKEEECDTIIDDLKNNSVLEQLVEKCGGRYHICSKNMNNQSELRELMDRIKHLFNDNDQQFYTRETFKPSGDLQKSECQSGSETEASIGEDNTQPLGSLEQLQTNKDDKQKIDPVQLFDRIHLQDKNQNLRSVDFLKPVAQESQESCAEEELASVFLQKLMMMDYRARCLQSKKNNKQHNTQQTSEDVGDVFDTIFGESAKPSDETNKLDAVHLMDVQMAVFHCADSFLKQLIVTKLSQCQYALPLLVPNPFTQQIELPLWAFRHINKSWKTTDDKGKCQPVYKAETPMVAFFRFGPVTSSKSQLMNSLINEKHNTFFHRNCPGSSRTRVLMDGLVEIAWYCPSGEKTDRFTTCVAFCNLHGDAGANEKQLDILTEMASVNVAILPQLCKNDKSMTKIQNFYKDSKPLILLLTDNDSALEEMHKGKYKIGLKDRNQSDIFEEIRRAINDELLSFESSPIFKLEDVSKHSGIRVDEDSDEDLRRGKEKAQQIMILLQGKDLAEIKESVLPLQGKLWHQWCEKNKELHRPTLGELHKWSNIEKNKSSKQSEMLKIREQQQASVLSQFIQIFIQNLNSPVGNEVSYFLKWLGILLDDYTAENLSALLHQYDEKWSTVLKLKKKHDKSQQLTAAQVELETVSEKLQAATFGLEHILREIGQIYESCSSVKRNKKNLTFNFSSLPSLAAEMMISGFPLELMDGDAAHVPLIWVTAVLDALIQKLGNMRVYVLSILGIQSSGKSTMLNAMFGLQFAVSAGRCTRGAFMQLVRVSEEMKTKLKFDYILVVDTEGLRALELTGRSTRNHDNEMATFVVGLGNMTLINIFGENTAEMQDILQIVVQAFMRMKKIKLKPSCMFVHQNVSDISAGEKNMEGRRRLQEKLDEMTKLAAKEEECNTEFFSDVIKFDIQNDVKYFAQLWEGSPPMAPPNPNYSRNIQELKDTILSKALAASNAITLSQFKMRINDLWNALLNESFVFSFKNTLEIAIYRQLETKYSNWTYSLRSAMLSIEDKFYNRIANGNIKVQDKDLLTDMRKTKELVEKSMMSYFEEDKDKEILCQWRGRFENRIKDLHDDLVKGTKRKLDEAIEQKKAREKLDQKRTECENMLFRRSKELALRLKDTGTDENMCKEFDQMWSKWVTEMTKDTPPLEELNFWDDVTRILSENQEMTFVRDRLQLKDFKSIDCRGDYCVYMRLKKHLEHSDEAESSGEAEENSKKSGIRKWFGQKLMSGIDYFRGIQKPPEGPNAECHYSIRNLTQKIIQDTEMIIKKSPVGTRGYSDSYIQEIKDCVQKSVKQHESQSQKYTLKKEFSIDLSLHVCDTAIQKFTELHKEFREANDPRIYLEKQKGQYWNIFEKYYRGATTTTILSEFICSKLEPSILQAVYNTTAIGLAAQMRTDIKAFCENRPNLEKHILKSLAEKEDFGQYIKYIHNPREHFKQFIKNEVDGYYTKQNKKILNIFKGNLKQKEQIVSNAVKAATVEVKSRNGDGNMWFRCFTRSLTDELKLTENSCGDLSEIEDLDFLETVLSDSLKKGMKKLNSITSINDMNMCRKRPDEILIDHFCQCCWVQCPFCKAICTNTMEDHPGDHSVPFHRNTGLSGFSYRGTTNLCIDFCTTAVGTERSFYPNSSDDTVPWKEYRKGGPRYANWSITPDHAELSYWKWFVWSFQQDLEEHYSKTFQGSGQIPDEWRDYTKEDALDCLHKHM